MSGAVQRILTIAGRGCVAALALALVLHGSTKRPPVRHSAAPAPSPAPAAVRTAPSVAPVPGIPDPPAAPPGMCAATNWWRRGAFSDWRRVDFPAGWSFPWGTNRLHSAALLACGEVRPLGEPVPVASVGGPLALAPLESVLWYGPTPSNTFAFVWRGALAGRNRARPADARIELFRNGDAVVSTDGVARRIPRALPFAHDGYGQDADWVRANFTNAEEILSVGYADWVDAQVGVGLANGLYRFEAVFPEDPPEATRLLVGGFSVCVTNAGTYTFVLEKGREYRFGTEPHDGTVRYAVRDDMGSPVPAAQSAAPGVWTVGGGTRRLALPRPGSPGCVLWMPTLRGSPNLAHLGPGPFPAAFEAVLSDYCGDGTPPFSWWASDPSVRFTAPNARTTRVEGGPLPGWGSLEMSVRADLPGGPLVSHLSTTYGTNETPQVRLNLGIPRGIPVGKRLPAALSFESDVRTNGWLVLECISGEGRAATLLSDAGEEGFACSNRIDSSCEYRAGFYVQGMIRSRTYEDIAWRLTFRPDDGEVDAVVVSSTVFGCYCQPVLEERTPDGLGLYNPCCIGLGKEALFRVDVLPALPPEEIVWNVLEGGIGFPSGTHGQKIRLVGGGLGNARVGVSVLGYHDGRMEFEMEVVE